MLQNGVIQALERLVPKENIYSDLPLAPLTTFRVGGACACLVEVESTEQLVQLTACLHELNQPYFVLGNGSNTIVKDQGYNGVILHVGNRMKDVRVEENRIIAQAGAMLIGVSNLAAKNSLSGLEFAAGIPGTVGGGIVMNAGAYDGEMSFVVSQVTVVTEQGELLTLDKDAMEFAYRNSLIRKNPGMIVAEVAFELTPGNPEEITGKMKEFNRRRSDKQPLEFPSAGSTFKRPEGKFAGELIMNAGLRGFQIGGARVSDKHCGFLINAGGATAGDVLALIEEVQKQVKEQFDVELEPEVVVLGD